MTDTINNGIPFVPENTIDPAAGINLALLVIDRLLQLRVLGVKIDTPPGSPTVGDRYIVGATPTGAWAGESMQVAEWMPEGYWGFSPASVAVYSTSVYLNTGSDWVPSTPGSPASWGGIVGTLADQTDLASALGAKADTASLSAVATSGDAADVSIADAGNYYTGTQVEAALQEAGLKLSGLTKVASATDTTADRLLTTDYLDIGKLDKTLWPKATSLLTLKNGPDRTVWVEAGTVDAPHAAFYGAVSSKRFSSTDAIMEATPLFEVARYTYVSTGFGDSGWVKETRHEVGEWVDLRPYLLSPYFWDSARDGSNHFPQIRLVDRNTVELRGIASYNASSAAPPTGIAFRVPEAFRPQMTSAGLCFSDAESPLWFGHAFYMIQGQVNYNSLPAWAQGNVQIVPQGAPNPVTDGAVDLSGIRYYLS